MDNKITQDFAEAYSNIYKEGRKYGLTKGTGKPGGAMAEFLKKKKEDKKDVKEAKVDNLVPDYKRSGKRNERYGNPYGSLALGGGIQRDRRDDHYNRRGKKTKNVKSEGKYRSEWNELKLIEQEEYVNNFNEWKNALVEEGYDVDRWTDKEMIETFINENDLWSSKDSVITALSEAKDKKGKGSGTKDACYKKVKARYDVWPSAYGSGALSKCRKVGAANWGNSSKKEDFSDWRDELGLLDENRATAYTAGMSDGQKAAEMRKISPKVADQAGRSHDKFMFGKRKKDGKFNKDYNKNVLKDKKYNQNTTGRGMPVSYRDSYEKDRDGVIQSRIRQGNASIKDLGKKK